MNFQRSLLSKSQSFIKNISYLIVETSYVLREDLMLSRASSSFAKFEGASDISLSCDAFLDNDYELCNLLSEDELDYW